MTTNEEAEAYYTILERLQLIGAESRQIRTLWLKGDIHTVRLRRSIQAIQRHLAAIDTELGKFEQLEEDA